MAQTRRNSLLRIVTPGDVVLGRFRILGPEPLNVGGMGVLWEAIVVDGAAAGEKRVVKVMLPELATDRNFVARFRAEIEIARTMGEIAPHLFCRVYGCYDDDEYGCLLVLELLHGSDLAHELARAKEELRRNGVWTFSREEALRITHSVLRSFVTMHQDEAGRHEVIHRDIKPENIFLCTSGEVRVLDFGISKLARAGAPSLTRTGYSLGTPLYMPYEQHMGWKELDARVDIHALGMVLFEMLSGRLPYKGENSAQLVTEMGRTGPVKTAAVMPSWDGADEFRAEVAAFVDCAIKVERDERWQTARDMLAALEDMMRRYGCEFVPSEMGSQGAPLPTKPARPDGRFGTAPTVAVPTPTSHEGRVPAVVVEAAAVVRPTRTPARPRPRARVGGRALIVFGILLLGLSVGGLWVLQHGPPQLPGATVLGNHASAPGTAAETTQHVPPPAATAAPAVSVHEISAAACRVAPYAGARALALFTMAQTAGVGTVAEQQALCCCYAAGDVPGNGCRKALARAGNLRRCSGLLKGR